MRKPRSLDETVAAVRENTRVRLETETSDIDDLIVSPEVLQTFIDEVLPLHWPAILAITADNTIAVVVHDAKDEWTTKVLPFMGWDRKAPVFAFNRTRADKMAAGMGYDPVAAAWMKRRVKGQRRIFAVVRLARFLFNVTADGAVEREPGSYEPGS
jgi:hypothetical protein